MVEARAFEEVTNVGKGDVCVGSSREDVGKGFAGFAHGGMGVLGREEKRQARRPILSV
jgi:hypothetical protein